jgi:hypothetical protein
MMEELTHPVELTDEELELVSAGGGCERGSLINVSHHNIEVDVVQANLAIGAGNNQQNF